MINPTSAPPVGLPGKPVLSLRSAPPGAASLAPAADRVELKAPVAEAPAPEHRPSKRALVALGLMTAVAAAGIFGGMAMQQADVEPARPVAARTVEARPAANHAPVTLSMEAPAAASVNFEAARLGVQLSPTPFQSQDLRLSESQGTETRVVNGQTLSLKWSHTGLEDARTGDFHAAGDLTAALETFNQEATSNQEAHATMQPAGSMGRFASVIVRDATVPGAPESVSLRTYDRDSGNQAFLQDLLGDEAFHVVMESVQGRLAAADGAAYSGPDVEAWANQSFSLAQQGEGTKVTVAIPSASGRVAQFTFSLAPGTIR